MKKNNKRYNWVWIVIAIAPVYVFVQFGDLTNFIVRLLGYITLALLLAANAGYAFIKFMRWNLYME